MAIRRSGPTGSGLIPPVTGSGDPGTDDDQNDTDDVVDEDIDGLPPLDEGDEEDADGDEDDESQEDLADLENRVAARLEQQFQARFDRAVSKMRRNLERQLGNRSTRESAELDEDDDEDEGNPPPRKRRRPQGQPKSVDVTSIRLLARDMVSDRMAQNSSVERAAVKSVLDAVLPAVNWSQVDEDDFVSDLVETLAKASGDLVRSGSDRKVAQLRRMGIVSERKGQPSGGGSRQASTSFAKAMKKGADAAEARFPNGERRLMR